MSANRFRFRAWVREDMEIDSFGDYTSLKKGWLKGQCNWFHLSHNGQELMWGWEECEEPLIVGRNIDIMFSTGLTDRNGKEVFEGDLFCEHGEHSLGANEQCWQVEWCSEEGRWDAVEHWPNRNQFRVDRDALVSFECPTLDDFEVCGNIYQNPELLGADQ